MSYIVMIGDPFVGFSLFGPIAEAEAAYKIAERQDVQASADCCWVFKLGDEDPPIEGEDSDGSAVVFAGNLFGELSCNIFGDTRKGWQFFGPFTNLDAATKWAVEVGPGADYAIELRPPKEILETV